MRERSGDGQPGSLRPSSSARAGLLLREALAMGTRRATDNGEAQQGGGWKRRRLGLSSPWSECRARRLRYSAINRACTSPTQAFASGAITGSLALFACRGGAMSGRHAARCLIAGHCSCRLVVVNNDDQGALDTRGCWVLCCGGFGRWREARLPNHCPRTILHQTTALTRILPSASPTRPVAASPARS